MNIEKQNEFLLSLVNRLYLEVGAYRVLGEIARNSLGSGKVDSILADARSDSMLRSRVDSSCLILSAGLPLADEEDADRLMTQFLAQSNRRQAPD